MNTRLAAAHLASRIGPVAGGMINTSVTCPVLSSYLKHFGISTVANSTITGQTNSLIHGVLDGGVRAVLGASPSLTMQPGIVAGHLTAKSKEVSAGGLNPGNFREVEVRLAALAFIPHEVKEMKIRIMGALTCAVAGLAFTIPTGMPLAAHAQDQANPPSSTAPDNSGQNKAHRKTAENQKENTSDREITQKIRRSIVSEKSLSTYAHNVKIITQDGQVTLKGPVRNENEKKMIASKAADVVGAEKVNNQLTVKQ